MLNDAPYRENAKPPNAPPELKIPTSREVLVDFGKVGTVILKGLGKFLTFFWYAFWAVGVLIFVGLFTYYVIFPVYIYWIAGVSIIVFIFLSVWFFKFISSHRQYKKKMAEYNMENGK